MIDGVIDKLMHTWLSLKNVDVKKMIMNDIELKRFPTIQQSSSLIHLSGSSVIL
jgi:hypothetical protein